MAAARRCALGAVAVVACAASAARAAAPSGRALWVWHNARSPLASPEAATEFLAFVRASRNGALLPTAAVGDAAAIELALVEAEALGGPNESATVEAFNRFLPTAAMESLSVAPLFGWSASAAAARTEGAAGRRATAFPAAARVLAWVDAAVVLANAHPAVTGVSFDVEPREDAAPGSHQAWADLLAAVRRRLDGVPAASRPRLSIAGSWGYESVNVTCSGPMAGANVTMLDCAVSLVDTYILMNYRNSAIGCFCRPPPKRNAPWLQCPHDGRPIPGNCTGPPGRDGMVGKAVTAAEAVNRHAGAGGACRLSLGVETSCFPPSDTADRRYEYKLSYCNTSLAYLNSQIGQTETGLRAQGLWDGVADAATPWAIEDYTALRALEGAPPSRSDNAPKH